MHPVLFNFSNLVVPTQIILIAIGLCLGLLIAIRRGVRDSLHWKVILDATVASIVCGLIVGRLWCIVMNWSWFQDHPSQMVLLSHGGVSFVGSFIGATLGVFLISTWYSINFFKIADALTLMFLWVWAFAALAAFYQGSEFGMITSGDFSVVNESVYASMPSEFPRQPVALITAVVAALLYLVFQITNSYKMFHGQVFSLSLTLIAIVVLILSHHRQDQLLQPITNGKLFGLIWTADTTAAVTYGIGGVVLFFVLKSKRLSV